MPTWHMNMVKIAITVLNNYWHKVISNWSRCIYSDILGSIRVIPDRQLNNNKVIHQLPAVNINSVQSSNASIAVHSRDDCPIVTLRSTDMTVGKSVPAFPVEHFCKLVRLMDTGRNQNLLCVPESESCPLKIRAYFNTIR